ncbi:hypothetical protein ES705_06778 [subsurface metagenome]|jgi:uncharacterized delta-60 repeat protein
MKILIVIIQLFLLFTFTFSQPYLIWTRTYNSGNPDYAFGVVTDSFNNIIIAGSSYNGSDYDFYTIKYTPYGDTIWTRVFDAGGSDIAHGIAIDNEGNFVITGTSRLDTIYDYLTIKYDSSGNFIWEKRYQTGEDNIGTSVAFDSTQNIIITGYSFKGLDYDYLTIKYNSNGDTIWTRRYDDGFNDIANDITTDRSGNIIVTGSSFSDTINLYTYLTIKYSPDGETLWTRRYHYDSRNSYAHGVAADTTGAIIVSGQPDYPGRYITLKYTPQGDTIWTRYHYLGSMTSWCVRDVAIDRFNDIIITGEYYSSASIFDSYNYHTLKYTSGGDSVWVIEYDSGDDIDDYAQGVACDLFGCIIITGYAFNENNADYLTIKYTEEGAIVEKIRMPAAVKGFEVYSPYPNPFKSQTQIKYLFAKNACIKINVYDINGRLVRNLLNQNLQEGVRIAVWDGKDKNCKLSPPGVYFMRLETPNKSITKKIIKIK